MDNHHDRKQEQTGIKLTKDDFSLCLYKTNLSTDQWARICLLFSTIDEVLREDNGDDPVEWRKCG